MIRRGRTVAAVTALLLVAACGSTDPGVSAGAARELHAGVQLVRAAAAQGDRPATAAAVGRLDRTLARLSGQRAVSPTARERIRRATARVRAELGLLPAPTTTTTTTTTTRPAEPEPRGRPHDEPKGHGKGRHDD
jgi:hypothetical protein